MSSSQTRLDRKLNSYVLLEPTDKTKDFLGDFLEILPPGGKENLEVDILECSNDEKLRQLVQSIKTGLLIPLKEQGGKIPTEVTLSPHSGVEDSIEDLSSQSQLWNRCLERDGNKCLATGLYSHAHAYPRNAVTTYLEAAYIIPFALGSFQANHRHRNTAIWVNLRRYFPVLRNMCFTSEQINSENNIMMLDNDIHKEFGHFRLIFEETGTPQRYRIKTFPDTVIKTSRLLPENRIINFGVHNGSWELPDPRLLQIHASIGNFLHVSGQAEVIDKILGDFEDCDELAPSRSTNVEDLAMTSLAY
ncbi:hypothetical protein DTO013E5_1229 [Penicillium roqueforti]|uniref:Genomic scaffold, ProqFM164S01 n=1 Tax=Penicillium roqueforti (strain FM164) TaxID=1365484 RepID=W6PY90_PENRF|nr:uncharacterized protein LCP9604111_2333 [Penicillium roqueforti]CDM28970.1 unnamed protein product [Penicillium roqueforti FM164]KAF9252337.1 hypothetical protein LCP9604111_2333 [Penicillium roqueforti]KAI1837607.1 hypothetical protein CBS147337_1890 [Penicillium roqueforti]KAI2690324.1 hypothetical protein CBS147355_775 [Penicillium roqueforti]KAI2721794.1 hypothetical protein CBS147318_2409 [Penicillium roqueforti]